MTTSAPSTASRTDPNAAAVAIPGVAGAAAARVAARRPSTSVSLIVASGSTAPITGRWLAAWTPAPSNATHGAPAAAADADRAAARALMKWRIATPLIAAVLWAVMVPASMTAIGSPVRASLSRTRP